MAVDPLELEELQGVFMDYIRFMKSNNELLCFYRKHLGEPECVKHSD